MKIKHIAIVSLVAASIFLTFSIAHAAMYIHAGTRYVVSIPDAVLSFVPQENQVIFKPFVEDSAEYRKYSLISYDLTDAPTAAEHYEDLDGGLVGGDFLIWCFTGSVPVESILGSSVSKEDGEVVTHGSITGIEYTDVTMGSIEAYIFESEGYTFAFISARDRLSAEDWSGLIESVRVRPAIR